MSVTSPAALRKSTTDIRPPLDMNPRDLTPRDTAPPPTTIGPRIAARADAIYVARRAAMTRWTDHLFGCLLVAQWVACVLAALWIAPQTWIGAREQVHAHVLAAIGLGGVLALFPVVLVLVRPGQPITRHAIAVAQMLFGALLIALMGGRIETHFHVFGSLAFLAFYRDWRVLVTATVVVVADHFLRGTVWPQSIFGVAATSPWRWVEHAGWVVFIDLFLVTACIRGDRETRAMAERQAEAEITRESVEELVEARTHELERAKVEAETATRAKTQFLANMSHEIRTPMTAILGFTELLADARADECAHAEHIRTIRRNGEHLLDVINDILDISRIESGHIRVELASCSPCQIVAEVAALMRVRAADRDLRLDVEYAFPVPERIESDAMRLRQILLNLLGNAIKFTDRGGIRLIVRHLRSDADRGMLVFDVVDSGIGMTDEQLARLFRPFSQVDSSAARRFGGTGLGLAISQRLAHLLNGEISVRSEPGVGTTFSLAIRLVGLSEIPMVNSPSEVFAETSRAAEEGDGEQPPLEARILLAEDGPDNQRLIKHVLTKAGAAVELAENGSVALRLATEAVEAGRPFDVILMDIQMPELDGYEATRMLRRKGYEGLIIALTAHAMDGFRQKCLEIGCDDYATKPIDRAALLRTLRGRLAERHDLAGRS